MTFGTSARFKIDLKFVGAEKEADVGDKGKYKGSIANQFFFFLRLCLLTYLRAGILEPDNLCSNPASAIFLVV